MKEEHLRNLAIAILVLGVGLVFLSGQVSPAAAGSYGYAYPYPVDYCSNHYGYYNMTYWGNYGYPYYYGMYPMSSYCYGYYGNYGYYGYPNYYSYYNYNDYYSAPAKYQLTVVTDPGILGTATGNGTYTSGTSASFTVTQNVVQKSPGVRYVFSHWTGDYSGVGTSGAVTMDGARKVVAVYQLQYHLDVGVQPQSAPLPSVQGDGWYNVGDNAMISVAQPIIDHQDGSRLVFTGWNVDGQSNSSSTSLLVTMNSAHSVSAQYKQQYYLKVVTDQGVPYGEGWYDAGSTASISVSTPVSKQYGVSIVFNGWQGDLQSGSQSATVSMDRAKTVIATWRSDPTVLNLTIALGVVAAFVIAGSILAYALLGRRNSSPQPVATVQQQAQTRSQTDQPTPKTSNMAAPHRRRRTVALEKNTTEVTDATGSTAPPSP
jgi:hypothetical protein